MKFANTWLEIFSVLFIGAYVVITAITLRQLVNQTKYLRDQTILLTKQIDLQFDAQLKMVGLFNYNLNEQTSTEKIIHYATTIDFNHPEEKTDYLDEELQNKVKKVTRPIFNFRDEDIRENYFVVSLTNYGSTNIEHVELTVSVTVKYIPRELYEKFNVKEFDSKELHIHFREIIERNGGKVIVPIINVSYFPGYNINVKGTYSDIRGKKYTLQEISLFGATGFQNLK